MWIMAVERGTIFLGSILAVRTLAVRTWNENPLWLQKQLHFIWIYFKETYIVDLKNDLQECLLQVFI